MTGVQTCALPILNQVFQPFTRAERTADGAYQVSTWNAEDDIIAGQTTRLTVRSEVSFEEAIERLKVIAASRLLPTLDDFEKG